LRLASVDALRGLVMVLMALDHTRDYFSSASFDSLDVDQTTPGLFLTRWITHFCAPAFFLLAGLGPSLSRSRGKSPSALAQFLLTRGAFLVLVDLTLVRLGWDFNLKFQGGLWFIVLSTLGFSMMALAGLVYLPRLWVGALGVALIAGHNLLDGVQYDRLGPFGPLWTFLHVHQADEVAGVPFYVTYPFIPWVGVMAIGYALGLLTCQRARDRRRSFLLVGAGLTAAFIVLRAVGHYGDPEPWSPEYGGVRAVLSFLRTMKYPPSLQYLLMTLGPILLALGFLEGRRGPLIRWLTTFGRVPLFFYVAHLYVIHALVVAVAALSGFDPLSVCVEYNQLPDNWGFSLPVVYFFWLLVLGILYAPCAWFRKLKKRSKNVLLSYL
jgi:uncharacterized membrane protein